MSADLSSFLLVGACPWPLLGLVVALAVHRRARRSVGPALHGEAGSRGPRLVLWLAHLALLLGVLFGADPAVRGPLVVLLGLSLALTGLTPSTRARVLGRSGVRSGWRAAPYARLDEWRLTGEHLRFRLGPEWSAVACPAALQGEIRELLEREAPGRESRFRS